MLHDYTKRSSQYYPMCVQHDFHPERQAKKEKKKERKKKIRMKEFQLQEKRKKRKLKKDEVYSRKKITKEHTSFLETGTLS